MGTLHHQWEAMPKNQSAVLGHSANINYLVRDYFTSGSTTHQLIMSKGWCVWETYSQVMDGAPCLGAFRTKSYGGGSKAVWVASSFDESGYLCLLSEKCAEVSLVSPGPYLDIQRIYVKQYEISI